MVKWLELLDNGAESCHKIVSLRLNLPWNDWNTLLTQQ